MELNETNILTSWENVNIKVENIPNSRLYEKCGVIPVPDAIKREKLR